MFGDLMGMMGKLKETQEKVEATKKRMETVLIDEESSDKLIQLTVTANSQLKSIAIADELLNDKEQLEDYLILTLNKALSRAQHVYETEVAAVAKDGIPDIPGMDLFKSKELLS
ncbi:MAG: YbaB/EbfC family nucleoid-associated protein [Flavobacteriaceae bacterium]|nr:YbaB/EbfC family nucleoid-associated protein [Flavobacteriaceae bacterium]